MAVYVDPLVDWRGFSKRWRYAQACHMTADTLDELHAMAQEIGLKLGWFQDGSHPHYDLTESKRKKAVRAGAVKLSWQDVREQSKRAGLKPAPTRSSRDDIELKYVEGINCGTPLAIYAEGHIPKISFLARMSLEIDEFSEILSDPDSEQAVSHEWWRVVPFKDNDRFVSCGKDDADAFAVTCYDLESWDRGETSQAQVQE